MIEVKFSHQLIEWLCEELNCGFETAENFAISFIGELQAGEALVKKRSGPTIVCLCGSTRFFEAFQKANLEETLAGRIVLTIGCDTKKDGDLFEGWGMKEVEALKGRLDELHLRKIDLADEVLILNVGGYIGESTRRELEYAKARGKQVRFLEPDTM